MGRGLTTPALEQHHDDPGACLDLFEHERAAAVDFGEASEDDLAE